MAHFLFLVYSFYIFVTFSFTPHLFTGIQLPLNEKLFLQSWTKISRQNKIKQNYLKVSCRCMKFWLLYGICFYYDIEKYFSIYGFPSDKITLPVTWPPRPPPLEQCWYSQLEYLTCPASFHGVFNNIAFGGRGSPSCNVLILWISILSTYFCPRL